MSAERDAVRVHRRVVEERLHDAVGGDDCADRGIRRREPLRAGDHVGLDVVVLGAEPGAEAAEAGDHLVGAEQDSVLVADLAHALPVARRRRERAAGILHRLHQDHRHRLGPRLLDRRVEVLEQERGELLLGLVLRPVVAVGVAHVDHVRHERLERRANRRDAVDREGAHRRAVVGDATADGLPAPLAARRVVLARELPRRLDRLRSAGDEEHAVEVPGRQLRDLVRELDRARMRIRPVRVEGELAHLLERGLAHLLAVRVADLDGEEPGQRVEVALAVRVLEVAAVSAHDDRRLLAAHAREVQPEVVSRGLLKLFDAHRGAARAHSRVPQS